MLKDLNAFLDEHFPYCAGKFAIGAPAETSQHACKDLFSEEGLLAVVRPFLDRHPDVDRRAALSVWAMYYFSHLAISPAVLWLVQRCAVSLSAADLDIRLDAGTGLPATVLVRQPLVRVPARTMCDAFEPLVFDHAAPLIETFSHFGLSPRLLWSNLAVYIEWIIRELGGRIDPALGVEGLAILEKPDWPNGRPNPLHGLFGREYGEDGLAFTRRRVCCLRYLLPGMPGCGMICPLPSGRA